MGRASYSMMARLEAVLFCWFWQELCRLLLGPPGPTCDLKKTRLGLLNRFNTPVILYYRPLQVVLLTWFSVLLNLVSVSLLFSPMYLDDFQSGSGS